MPKKISRVRATLVKVGDVISIRGGEAKVADVGGPFCFPPQHKGEPFFRIYWFRYRSDGDIVRGILERRAKGDINIVTEI